MADMQKVAAFLSAIEKKIQSHTIGVINLEYELVKKMLTMQQFENMVLAEEKEQQDRWAFIKNAVKVINAHAIDSYVITKDPGSIKSTSANDLPQFAIVEFNNEN